MYKLARLPQPDCLASNAPEWTEDFVTARKADPHAAFSWRSAGCYQTIRSTLLEMTQSRCAFCDAFVGAASRETVEHFRPKKHFPELAYLWSNLFPCCDVCQSSKRELFDELLLRPDDEAYSFSRYFVANFRTGEVDPSPAAPVEDQERARRTIAIYGMNIPQRKAARLREWRKFSARADQPLADFNYRYFLQ